MRKQELNELRKGFCMLSLEESLPRRTTTDIVFEQLHEDIASIKILPGTKLSETEIAQRFGVSRQPVRDAFNRLENLDLLLIRPQRATEVRGFSMKRIAHARFLRLAVELEVIRHACSIWNDERAQALDHNLQQQQQAHENGQPDQFHLLDYQFHNLICKLGDHPLAFYTIEECKRKVDRLCMIGLDRKNETGIVLADHLRLANALKNGSVEEATSVTRQHLARLDQTITNVYTKHSEYFE